MKKQGSLTYIYAGLFLAAVLIILIGNSYFLIDRTRANLIEIYWKQGELIVKSIAVSARQSIDSVDLTPQQIRRHLKRAVSDIEKADSYSEGINPSALQEILRRYELSSIELLDSQHLPLVTALNDNEEPAVPEEQISADTDEAPLVMQTVTIARQAKPGFVRIKISPRKLRFIQTQIGLQLLVASLEHRNVVQTISFIDEHFRIVADSDPFRVGTSEEEIEYLDVLKSGVSFFFRDSEDEVMKIIHPLDFTAETRGVVKIAYPITSIDKIYENTFKSVALNSSVVMLIAIVAAVIAVKLAKRNLDKIESMEKQIRENEKLASLANLTAGVAHEVRNPLNSVSITIQRLQIEFTPKNDEDREEYASLTELMKREVDRINRIITEFLDFAKPFEPKKTRFEIDGFIKKGLSLIKPEADKNGVNLIANLSIHKETFLGDQEKLTQVLINVMKNALDVSSQHDTITIDSFITNQRAWVLQIKDNGPGITKENLSHIFEIYFTTKKSGTGLGLYICRKIVQAHGGRIELTPNIGKGITVSITLPFLEI